MAKSITEQKSLLSQLSERRIHSEYPKELSIVAEGDSWFNYPYRMDVIDHLIKDGYAINNLSKYGDTLENIIYGNGFTKTRTKLVHHGPISLQLILSTIKRIKPSFFLFSAGGNDVVGEGLVNYLNHKNAGGELVNKTIFTEKLKAMKGALSFLIESIERVHPFCHILMDGYDYAKVNGKGYEFLGIELKGPWIEPSFAAKAIINGDDQKEIISFLVDDFNSLLKELDATYPNFHYIDLRNEFPHENSWDNEIHLKSAGYRRVADLYNEKINDVMGFVPISEFKERIIV